MIAHVEWTRFELPLRRPLRVGGVELERRSGLIVQLRDAAGRRGCGEIAPLPGLHRENLTDAERELSTAATQLTSGGAASPQQLAVAAPSVQFGLETAWQRLLAQVEHRAPPTGRVAISGLVDADPAVVEAALAAGALQRYPALKVKIGRRPPDRERAVLQMLCDAIPEVTLRLDGNRALDLDDAIARLRCLPPERIEYAEEPLRDPGALGRLHAATGVGIGLDEALAGTALPAGTADGVVAWILKPSLLGAARVRELSRRAAGEGIDIVISACFESGLGLWALAELAAQSAERAAGLGTDAWLGTDTVTPPFSSAAGAVDLADAIREPDRGAAQ